MSRQWPSSKSISIQSSTSASLSQSSSPMPDQSILSTSPVPPSLTLKIIKKDKNSPIMSIQKFIERCLLYQQPIEIAQLWNKYQMMEAHSLLIKNHNLDYETFKNIAETILETYQPYQLALEPNFYHQKPKTKIKNDDLIPYSA